MWPFSRKREEKPEEPKRHSRIKQSTRLRFFSAVDTSLLPSWDSHPSSIDAVLRKDLRSLRAKSREQYRNNDYARRYVNLLLANVVGPSGIQVQAQIKSESGELDKRANAAIEEAWCNWSTDHCDVAGVVSFVEMQRLAVASLAYDGEFVARIHYGNEYGPHGVQIEAIDPERIATSLEKRLDNGNVVRLGVEFAGAKPVALWLHDLDDRGEYQHGNAKRYPMVSNGRPALVHLFQHEFVGQCRGIPWLSTALYRMKMLNGYEEAAITAARIGASKAGFYTSETGESYQGDDEDTDGSLIQELEPGAFEQLPAGMSVSTYDPSYPHEQYESFMKRTLMGMSSGLNIGYNAVANDPENTSYSTLRQFELENRDAYRVYQQLLIKFVRRVRNEAWLPMVRLASDFTDARRSLQSCLPATFQGRRWDWVDPEKDMRANEAAIRNRVTSVSQIIRDRGGDPEEVFREISAEREKLAELGIQPTT